jgi:hypothetical protein
LHAAAAQSRFCLSCDGKAKGVALRPTMIVEIRR